MNFASDNTPAASARIIDAIVGANAESLPSYGADPYTKKAKELLAETFGTDVAIHLVTTGTAANALSLGALTPPGGVIFCHAHAHVIEEECAAPEFYAGAGKLVGIGGADGKIDPDALRATLRRFPRGVVRQAQPACLSLSQATESGTVYTPDELRRLTAIAHEAGLAVHMDGARFANAVASLGCTPAALSHEAGVDILSLGATKNGTLACEAIVVFDKRWADPLPYMLKRGGHILSKGRFLGAQMAAYLEGGYWLGLAGHANLMARRLAAGLVRAGGRLPWPCEANEVFAILPSATCERLRGTGAVFYDWDVDHLPEAQRPDASECFVRMVCSFATSEDEVESLLGLAG